MLEEPRLMLGRALEMAAQYERVETQIAAMKVSNNGRAEGRETVNRVYRKEGKFPKQKSKPQGNGTGKSDKVCFRCGHGDHFAKDSNCGTNI